MPQAARRRMNARRLQIPAAQLPNFSAAGQRIQRKGFGTIHRAGRGMRTMARMSPSDTLVSAPGARRGAALKAWP